MQRSNIVNIIHFIRGQDCRVGNQALLETFEKQLNLCRSYPMPYTILLQYDAFMQSAYQKAIFDCRDEQHMEVGIWIEFCRQLIEKCGLEWHGREGFDWDWHVNPDMTLAYTVPERYRILDEIMNSFFSVFGYYPKSVGSWLLDSPSISYLYEKYHISAVCICKEQAGTDGYTLWGGYYNQGYYPSRLNMLCPAQDESQQIPVPVFRMLGIDPIAQYESGMDAAWNPSDDQKVFTLEPAWQCGQSEKWVDWFLDVCYSNEALSFANVQVGQENSFTWEVFGKGLEMQTEKIYHGFLNGRWKVEKLCDTGRNFREQYAVTPPTALTAMCDIWGKDRQSVWYNCKNYRINWFREKNLIGIRDAFLFDQSYPERYLERPAKGNCAIYDNLPLIDGYHWSGNGIRAFCRIAYSDGTEVIKANLDKVENCNGNLQLVISVDGYTFTVLCEEECMELQTNAPAGLFVLRFGYYTLKDTELTLHNGQICYRYRYKTYAVLFPGNAEIFPGNEISLPICQNMLFAGIRLEK